MSSNEFDPEEIAITEEANPEEYGASAPPLGFETDPVDHAEQADEIELDDPEA